MPRYAVKFVATALAAVAWLVGPPVRAQAQPKLDVDCAWAAIPEVTRDALTSAAPDPDRMTAAVKAQIDALVAAAAQCHVPQDAGERFGAGIGYKGLEVWAIGVVRQRGGVAQDALERAWASLPPAERASIAAEIDRGSNPSADEAADLNKLMNGLGLTDDQARMAVLYYVVSRSELEDISGH